MSVKREAESFSETGDVKRRQMESENVDGEEKENGDETESGSDYDDESSVEEDEDADYEGETNENGEFEGKGILRWPSGNIFEGIFKNGQRCGPGRFLFADRASLEGSFIDGELNGPGVNRLADGSRIEGTYVQGELTGPAIEYDELGVIVFKGTFECNMRVGTADFYMEGGGRIHGTVGGNGQCNGSSVTYFYPGYPLETAALQGLWEEGEMINAKYGHCTIPGDASTFVADPSVQDIFAFDLSTETIISTQPLLADGWESERVYVKVSSMTNAGEGLFAAKDLGANEVVSFYNGVRIAHSTVDNRDWALNSNTMSLDDEIVIDVPPPYDAIDSYCATLGHKANHCINHNAQYDVFTHPRFGPIKCIRSLRPIPKDEEITVDYGYDHDTLPEWYSGLANRETISK